MKGRELRKFALECLKAAQQTDEITDKDSYRMIAEGLLRRASEIDRAGASMHAPARLRKAQRVL